MSPAVAATPEDLEQFARELRQLAEQLREQAVQLRAQFDRVGETWQDAEQQKFAEDFQESLRSLDLFLTGADEHVAFLVRKAQRLREYEEQR